MLASVFVLQFPVAVLRGSFRVVAERRVACLRNRTTTADDMFIRRQRDMLQPRILCLIMST